jgi:hypothetical protein
MRELRTSPLAEERRGGSAGLAELIELEPRARVPQAELAGRAELQQQKAVSCQEAVPRQGALAGQAELPAGDRQAGSAGRAAHREAGLDGCAEARAAAHWQPRGQIPKPRTTEAGEAILS